jgi:hypothetical protein
MYISTIFFFMIDTLIDSAGYGFTIDNIDEMNFRKSQANLSDSLFV